MSQKALSETPIVNERRFILATRDTGYRTTAAAIAELVDNAIQASATIVRVFVWQEGVGSERQISVAVLDNGGGMDADTLSVAMQFAGSSRFNDRNGLGRFGMGLPNSSVSQARRVDVHTWQKRARVLHTYLDVDEISSGDLRGVPKPRQAKLPEWAEKYVRKQTGTLVQWTRCDRLDNRKAATIAEKLCRPLGQRFRHFLWQGNRITVNDVAITPFDPLHLQMNDKIAAARPFGDTLTFEFRTPSDPSVTSHVRVRFTELPVSEWYGLAADDKRKLGVVKGAGVSIVRANREIDFGWYFMGGKRKENYDDWWRCEISFDPELDELFGVTHSKQEINPTDLLRVELGSHLEAIAQTLNSRARSAFALVRKQEERVPSHTEAKATEREPYLPPVKPQVQRQHPERRPLKRERRSANPSPRRYRMLTEPLRLADAFTWDVNSNNVVTITINENHSFYDHVFRHLEEKANAEVRNGVEFLLLAFARAGLSFCDERHMPFLTEFRKSFSNILAAYLGD